MSWTRLIVAVALAAGLAVAATTSTSRSSAFPALVPCDATALSAPYRDVDFVSSFGCVGRWAYLWVTVGKGVAEVSVTEVERYDAVRASWANASRLRYCADRRVPAYVRQWGCHSN
jgi:hypothetical protein